ncbi:hypothetical protein SAM40697_5819 [Streptomyces ambofaciens]|uniref:DUF397 domain-containing protein n=1 Tax=Streptomyces ambofaciens TaxID=1889 RepID=A0ABM6B732_STRAM|nr:DUF397 domain-containing protein [Streptomyces ambofaciens]ANB09772.1 hypothetical protein SAM40697_5819 [Streptomyces ambofaciens]
MPLPTTGWYKSSYSTDFEEACVEACVAAMDTGVLVRDTKDRDCRPFSVSARAWDSFLSALHHNGV